MTFAIGISLGLGTPAALLAQANGRPSVVIDRTVLDQLGPPSNLPEMLLHQEQSALPPAKLTLTPPRDEHLSHRRHGAPRSPCRNLRNDGGVVHLHPVRPNRDMRPDARPITLTRPAKSAAPAAKTGEPVSLTPTLSPPAPAVTSETLAPPPEPKNKVSAVPAKHEAVTPTEAAPMPPIAAPPATIAPTAGVANAPESKASALTAQTAQPPGEETPANAAPQESLSTIRFDKETARLPDGARDLLAHLASRMGEDATLEVQLIAYAGGNEENSGKARRLSLSRALAVRSFLIDQGVRSTRIEVRALGNKVPDGDPERVDIALQKRG